MTIAILFSGCHPGNKNQPLSDVKDAHAHLHDHGHEHDHPSDDGLHYVESDGHIHSKDDGHNHGHSAAAHTDEIHFTRQHSRQKPSA